MFQRFTDRARRVVVLAQEEARLLNHSYIGTEHILLGLAMEADGVAAQALQLQGVQLGGLRKAVEAMIGRGGDIPSGHIPFTPRAKKILELSLRESIALGHDYIGTEHILLGLIRESEGVACRVLEQEGVDFDRLRIDVVNLLGLDPAKLKAPPKVPRRPRTGSCVHPAEDLEIRPAEGFRTVRCRRCGQLVGVLPAA